MTHYKIEMTTQPMRPWWAFWRPKCIPPFFTVRADGKPFGANRLTINSWASVTTPWVNRIEIYLDGRLIDEGVDSAEVWRDGRITHRIPPLLTRSEK